MATTRRGRATKACFAFTLAVPALFSMLGCGGGQSTPSKPSRPLLTRLSTDTFTNTDSQHATEVEPGIFASGSTIVTALQIGRRFNGGASDIGFATSTNGGTSWTNGVLPGLTVSVGGTYLAASDPSVTFDKAQPAVEKLSPGADFPFNGKATTNVRFAEAGDYGLHVTANDYSGDGGGGFQCCWTNGEVKVSVGR